MPTQIPIGWSKLLPIGQLDSDDDQVGGKNRDSHKKGHFRGPYNITLHFNKKFN